MMRCEARRRGGGGVECWVAIIHSFVWTRVLACLLACLPFNHTPAEDVSEKVKAESGR